MSKWKDIFISGIIVTIVVILSVIVYIYSKDSAENIFCYYEEICPFEGNMCNEENSSLHLTDDSVVLCTHLHINKNMIESILNSRSITKASLNKCDIVYYNDACSCGFKTRFFCKDGVLLELPQNIPSSVTSLGLQNNSISELTNQSLSSYNLNMFLDRHRITHIEQNTFKHQQNLSVLFLLGNGLTRVELGVFNGLSNLKWLHLNHNNLSRINLFEFNSLLKIKWMDLSHNNIEFNGNETFPYLPNLVELFLNNNKITHIGNGTFNNLRQLQLLNLRQNYILQIEEGSFKNLFELRHLDLYGNRLTFLSGDLLMNQKQLRRLFLGKNPLINLQNPLFKNLENLEVLNLEDIEILNIDVSIFQNLLHLEVVHFKYYKYCAFTPRVKKCKPFSDGISSTKQLLFNPIFRYSNWIMCFLSIIGNALVLFSRYLFRDKNKTLSIVLKNLAVSDCLMGIYLLIIGYHDMKYRDNYNSMSLNWISSWDCVFTGMFCMISQEVTVLLLVFMSLDRLLVITSSLKKHRTLTVIDTWKIILLIWCFGVIISTVPVVGLLSSTRFYGVNGLCLPLFIDDPYFIGWEYSALIFFGINAPSLVIIIICYVVMFISIRNTRNNTTLATKNSEFAVRFFFIILTNIACWLPMILTKIIVYFKAEVSDHVYGWLAVFILPINSWLNPILYTFTTRKYRRRLLNVPKFIKILSKTNDIKEVKKEIFYIKLKK